jgi:undecaprenyl diphosphate synthase
MSRSIPHHVAIIMDGNGRWAAQRGAPRALGHRAGVKAARRAVEAALTQGVEVLTLFAFSSENWRRPPQEIGLLMELFMAALRAEAAELHARGVRLRFMGERTAFPAQVQAEMAAAERLTVANTGLQLVIAANYGGQWELVQAARRLAAEAARGERDANSLDADAMAAALALPDLPPPDLFIRTGGEQRLSNFYLWQMAYTELYFTPQLWPDFDAAAFDAALQDYAGRQRRFGHTPEQMQQAASHA